MKAIKISEKAYEILKKKAERDKRTIIATIDIIMEDVESKE